MRRLGCSLALFALAACGPTPPTVSLRVTEGAGAPEIVGLARLQLVLQACGADAPLVDEALPVRGEAIPTRELDLVPGTEMYVHLTGWLNCGGTGETCTPPAQAGPDDCVCPSEPGQPAQILRAEGCSEWFRAEADYLVTVSLAAPAGLCPPLPTACSETAPSLQ